MSPLERESHMRRVKFGQLLFHNNRQQEEEEEEEEEEGYNSGRQSNASDQSATTTTNTNDEDDSTSSLVFSPWSQTSPYIKSPWSNLSPPMTRHVTRTRVRSRGDCSYTLMGSLLREDGHVYSLAVRGGTLYTGSNSKNIRVWRHFKDAGGFKSSSGFVKAIVVANDARVFTAHHDGKVRVWNRNGKRVGTLPKMKDFLRCSVNPNNYVEVRRRRKIPKIKHYDAVSCLALNEDAGVIYSGSWDKTVKVWRLKDFKCLESINAHSDAINSVVVGFGGVLFSGSADGTLKVWRRDAAARGRQRHAHVRTLLKGDHAVTSLAVAEHVGGGGVLYSGSSDGLVNFWWEEDDEGEMVYGGVLRGHKMAVLCLATAGCLVMSGSADKSICIWRRDDHGALHSCLGVLTGHCGPVKCLAVEEDRYDHDDDDDCDDDDEDDQGRRWIVYSGSLDKSVRIWRVAEHAPNHDDDST